MVTFREYTHCDAMSTSRSEAVWSIYATAIAL